MIEPLAALTLGAALAIAAPAAAETFVLVTYEAPARFARRADPGYWAPWNALAGRMAQEGVLRGGSALQPGGARVGQAAPRLASQMSGYFTLEVADRAAADAWAGRMLTAGAVTVEVHAQQPNPSMR